MATDPQPGPSFSPRRKWAIGFNVLVATLVVLAIVVMLNYLAGQYFRRVYLSTLPRLELSPRTLNMLGSLTNRITVTIYYDKDDPLYSKISDLLNEYHRFNTKITVTTVDYYRDPGAAQELKLKYKLGASTNRNFIIFDCAGRTKFVNGSELPDYRLDQVPNESQLTYDRKLIAFKGEMQFTAALYAVTHPKPVKAYFLEGHDEASVDDAEEMHGLHRFAEHLRLNYIEPVRLNLLGATTVPADCNLLIIAAPQKALLSDELEKLDAYLNDGGRLLVLFNTYSRDKPLGLEKLLARWGVDVGHNAINEPELTSNRQDMYAVIFGMHRVTKPLLDARTKLHLILPRRISRIEAPAKTTVDIPQVTELVYSTPASVATDDAVPRRYPLIVAVEKTYTRAGVTEHSPTRMVICGDAFLIGNFLFDDTASANRDFADSAVNWLLERSAFFEGLGPRKVDEFRLSPTQSQLKAVHWVLLAILPGAVLLFGGLVWFRRRK